MALPDSLTERLFYSNRKRYSERNGNVDYLDSKGLKRSFKMPAAQRVVVAVFVAIAVLIGYTAVDRTVLASYRYAQNFQASMDANLARTSSVDALPDVTQLVWMSDDDIRAFLTEQGLSYYDASDTTDSYDLLLYRYPSDVSAEEAALVYELSINGLDAVQATHLLNGGWFLGYDRENASMVVRCFDFTTGDAQLAVQNALDRCGIPADTMAESGVDDSGNTYAMGTVDVGDTTYSWKISSLPFDDVYKIASMPDHVCYTGIRLTAA